MPQRHAAPGSALARSITRRASRQSYLTIRALADPAYRADAYALYAYFRWLDDEIDERLTTPDARLALVERQRGLVAAATSGTPLPALDPHEVLLASLLLADGRPRRDAGGALASVAAMLDVMEFDARRRGRAVAAAELDRYTDDLAVAVTEALHHCIGHGCAAPTDETRYVAVHGAHVAHMLRDLREDLRAGYVNVPAEVVGDREPTADALCTPALCDWVRERVELAREDFRVGREYLARLESRRCRLAGHAYLARFEWVLDTVESDGYVLRECYPERRTVRGGLAIARRAVGSALGPRPETPELVRSVG
jgi:phytoene/squalene synthetase